MQITYPMHILLVEDNEADIFLATETLHEISIIIKVSIVTDGKQAIDFLTKACESASNALPDLILLDINLPKKNGHEVLQYIKSNKRLQHIMVIMLSTSSSERDINKAFDNFANGYIVKPLEAAELMNAIEKLEHSRFF